jgi:hypothetical protein
MTPPRLIELECPTCHMMTWTIDSDYQGIDDTMRPYAERRYACASSRHDSPG